MYSLLFGLNLQTPGLEKKKIERKIDIVLFSVDKHRILPHPI